MKIRLLIDCEGPNPEYDPPAPDSPEAVTYDVPHTISVPAGTEIEHPQAFLHCFPDYLGVVRAEPVDDEAKTAVAIRQKRIDKKKLQLQAVREKQREKQRAAVQRAAK